MDYDITLPFFVLPLSSNNEYSVSYSVGLERRSASVFDGSDEDRCAIIANDYIEEYKHDPTFRLYSVSCERFDRSRRVRAVREMFELGHRVRAESKIRNRQPLKRAYVLFTDTTIQSYMQNIDCGSNDYATALIKELNVFDVEFLAGSTDRFFDYNLKPNFRVLGTKGFGKQAQALKGVLTSLSIDERCKLLLKLKTDTVELSGIKLELADIEVEYIPKPGFCGATGKVGSIILDTSLDDALKEHGTVADFKSSMQNVRKTGQLDLLDKIDIEVYCNAKQMDALLNHRDRLKKDLLCRVFTFFVGCEAKNDSFKFDLDGQEVAVRMWKIG